MASPTTPAVNDLITIYIRELGAERAARLIGEAGVRASSSLLSPGKTEDAADPQRAAFQMWWWLWITLAEECPQAFLPRATTLNLFKPVELAFAYARRREPEGLLALELTREESGALRRGRLALQAITQLPELRRARAWVYNDCSLALRHYTDFVGSGGGAGTTAIALGHPLLGNTLFMGETSVANRRHNSYAISPINILPFTLLHEEIHAAVDFHFRPKSDERESALVSGLQEPPAIIGEFYALYLAQFDEPPTRKQLQSYSRFYPPQTRMGAFLRLCSADTEAEEVIRLAVKAAGLALCSANDSELANSLSSLLGTRRSARQLRRAFTASSSLTKC